MAAAISRTRRIALALGALGIVALSAPPALADPTTEPDLEVGGPVVTGAQEIVQDPVGEVKEVVTKTTNQAEEAAEETAGTAEDVVDSGTTVVGKTVDKVEEAVDRVVEGGNQPAPPAVVEPGKGPTRDAPRGPGRADAKLPVRSEPKDSAVLANRTHDSQREVADSLARNASAGAFAATSDEDSIERAARRFDVAPITPGEAAEKLAFPLLMTLAMAAFLALQGRFDRRDPKLMLQVDVDGERLSFE